RQHARRVRRSRPRARGRGSGPHGRGRQTISGNGVIGSGRAESGSRHEQRFIPPAALAIPALLILVLRRQGTSKPRTALIMGGVLGNLWRKRMRKVFILAAAAGLAGFVGSSGAIAMTSTSPAGVRVATEAMDSTALVHCRSYRHWHPWEHRWTHGCRGGTSVVIRHGHRVGVSESIRSRTTISRGETSVRPRSSPS